MSYIINNNNYSFASDSKGEGYEPIDSLDGMLPNIDPDPLSNPSIYGELAPDNSYADFGGEVEQTLNDLYNESLEDYFPEGVIPLDTDSDLIIDSTFSPNLSSDDQPSQSPCYNAVQPECSCELECIEEKGEWHCPCYDDDQSSNVIQTKSSSFNMMYLLPLLLLIK